MPALTKQDCNAGSCHGAPEGKGGFALSMLAYKPSLDEESLTTGGLARRIEPLAPAESLLLKKPLLRVTHVGGKRLHPGDVASTPPNVVHHARNIGTEEAVIWISFSSAARETVLHGSD